MAIFLYFPCGLLLYAVAIISAANGQVVLNSYGNPLSDVNIECNSNNIRVTVSTEEKDFNGMIYPKGLAKNSTCLTEYEHAGSKIIYNLPLRSCNTMNHYVNEGVEYFNTVVIQPHSKLVTSLGRGFHVRCRYQTKNKTVSSGVGVNSIGTTPMEETAPMPNCQMKIYLGRPEERRIAEHVKIGDYLSLVIAIEEQEIYGLKVSNCIVKDGLNWSEQPLIDNEGCPIDEEIMGQFEYAKNLTMVYVTYPAHKFPFTSSIYYQCYVKLCLKKTGGCDDVPPICDEKGENARLRRRKRQEVQDSGSLKDLRLKDEDSRDRSVEVYSGLYVNEVDELDENEAENPSSLSSQNDEDFCLSTRKFAIGIAIAGAILMLAVILLIACIVHRRRRRKGTSTTGSSIYSGPYSNHAYSRD